MFSSLHPSAVVLAQLALLTPACASNPPQTSQAQASQAQASQAGASPTTPAPASAPVESAAASTRSEAFRDLDAATAAAQSWLGLVDAAKYDESWSAAATPFKSAMSDEKWSGAVSSARSPLGKVLSRHLKSTAAKTSLPGAPDGKYVVIQFSTTFEKKAAAVETVTPMQEPDGAWRVSGYFIR
jgi:hypothetical protein